MQRHPAILSEIDTRDDLGDFLNRHNMLGTVVEVGTFLASYAMTLRRTWRGQKLICVDPYKKYTKEQYFDSTQDRDQEQVYREAQANLAQFRDRAEIWRMESREAAGRIADGTLDAVHLDGNHALEAVREDIAMWWPKVRPGGVFCGHDFFERKKDTNSDAQTAVLEFAERIGVYPKVGWCSSWFFIKQ